MEVDAGHSYNTSKAFIHWKVWNLHVLLYAVPLRCHRRQCGVSGSPAARWPFSVVAMEVMQPDPPAPPPNLPQPPATVGIPLLSPQRVTAAQHYDMWKYLFQATSTQRCSSLASSEEAESSQLLAKAAPSSGPVLKVGCRHVDFRIFEIFTFLFYWGTDPQREEETLFLSPGLAVTHCGRTVNLTPA